MSEKFLRDFLMLWATIDPIGTLSLFAALTAELSPRQRRTTATKAVLFAAMILVGAVVVGQLLLDGMGINLASLQVAGGVILFLFGLQMIFSGPARLSSGDSESGHDLSVFPLAVPSIASPGAITAVILLTDNDSNALGVQLGTTLIMLSVLAITWGLMLAAGRILRLIGKNGAAILIRVMGMILAALSVQLVMEALGAERWMGG